MSPFSQLLAEARDLLRVRHRQAVPLHFDWDPEGGATAWKCWASLGIVKVTRIHTGEAGEQALRRLVEELQARADQV